MIACTTTAVVTCDKCGRELKPGETLYQVSTSIASATVEVGAPSFAVVSDQLAQLCEADYQASTAQLAGLAPLAPATSGPAAVAVPLAP
jgi:hypothetical protein